MSGHGQVEERSGVKCSEKTPRGFPSLVLNQVFWTKLLFGHLISSVPMG